MGRKNEGIFRPENGARSQRCLRLHGIYQNIIPNIITLATYDYVMALITLELEPKLQSIATRHVKNARQADFLRDGSHIFCWEWSRFWEPKTFHKLGFTQLTKIVSN